MAITPYRYRDYWMGDHRGCYLSFQSFILELVMKQLQTTKATLLVVKVPEGNTTWVLYNGTQRMHHGGPSDMIIFNENVPGSFMARRQIPYADWEILGLSTEITEEVWRMIMPRMFEGSPNFPDYSYVPEFSVIAKNATESARSFIEANGFHWENPYEKPDRLCDYYRDALGLNLEYFEAQTLYNEAEQITEPFLILKLKSRIV